MILLKQRVEYDVNENGCWICRRKPNGHGYCYLYDADKTPHRLNRLVYAKKVRPIPKGLIVRHTCDVRNCINPDHLVSGTYKENAQDMVRHGRQSKRYGELNTKARATEAMVLAIRAVPFADFKTYKDLAKRFGISRDMAYQIYNRITWRHLP